jgi:hypothetical protein
MMIQRLDHDYCEYTEPEQIGGVHNLIRGLIQYADSETVIGYGDRIGQMIISGPALRVSCGVREKTKEHFSLPSMDVVMGNLNVRN